MTQDHFFFYVIALIISGAIFIASFAWGLLAIVRMLQITIATNVTLSRELSAIQQMIGKIPGGVSPTGLTNSPPKLPKDQEGEFVPYDEETLYQQELLLRQQAEKHKANGLSDEELEKSMRNAVNTSVD